MTGKAREGNRRRNRAYLARHREKINEKKHLKYVESRKNQGLKYEPLTDIVERAKDPVRQIELNRIRQEKYHTKNRDVINEKARVKRLENPEEARTKALAHYHAHKHERLTWAKKNPEKHRANRRARDKKRWAADPNYKLKKGLGLRMRLALNGESKSAKTLVLVGCTIEFLREHLEKQFVPGMTWENYGPVWHVDHILPCAEFHLQHSEEQEICFNWSNLQPLFVKDNILKSNKII